MLQRTSEYRRNFSLNFSEETLSDIDWDFPNLRNEGIHAFHWYPATFLSAIPGTLIPLLTEKDAVILDPFCGTSTTGLEAVRLLRRYIGVDSNPIATLISRARLAFPESRSLSRALNLQSMTSIDGRSKISTGFQHPNEDVLLRWYHPSTYRELLLILHQITRLKNNMFRNCAKAIYSSILKSASSQSKHWGWVCDNVTPKPHEIQHKDAMEIFHKAFTSYTADSERFLRDIRERDKRATRKSMRRRVSVYCDDALRALRRMDHSSVDLVMTSPPYFGVADYVKSQRLTYLWFTDSLTKTEGFRGEDFEWLRQREVGSRSFRHRQTSFQLYTSYMSRFMHLAHRVLKPEAALAIVLGHSHARSSTADAIEGAAAEAGFRNYWSQDRNIKKTRRRLMAKVPSEQIIVFKK